MPTVPRLRNTTVRATPEPSRLPAAETFGVDQRAVQAVGGALGNLAGVVQKERDRITDIRVSESEMDLNARVDALLVDPNSGLLQQRGSRAVEGLDSFRANVSRAVSEVSLSLKTPEQRMLFERAAARITRSADTRAMGHIGTETNRVRDEGFTSGVASDLSAVVTATLAGRAGEAEENRASGAERIALYGASVGRAPEVIAQQVADWNSKTWGARIQALANTSGSEDQAAQLFEAHKAKLTNAEDLLQTQTAVETASLEVQVQTHGETLMGRFKKDEAAAVAEARRTLTGRVENATVAWMRSEYAAREALKKQEIETVSTRAQSAVVGGQPITREDRNYLLREDPKTLDALDDYTAAGASPKVSDSDAFIRLYTLDNEAFANTNPAEYLPLLSHQDFQTYMYRRASIRGEGGRVVTGMNPLALRNEILAAAHGRDDFKNIRTLGDFKDFQREERRFQTLVDQVEADLEAWSSSHGGALPSRPEQLEAVNRVLYDRVVYDTGFGSGKIITRAEATSAAGSPLAEGIRELSTDQQLAQLERYGLPDNQIPPNTRAAIVALARQNNLRASDVKVRRIAALSARFPAATDREIEARTLAILREP